MNDRELEAPGQAVNSSNLAKRQNPAFVRSICPYDPFTGKSQEPSVLYQDGDSICAIGNASMCKNMFGRLMLWSQENCLIGCDAGKCTSAQLQEQLRKIDVVVT